MTAMTGDDGFLQVPESLRDTVVLLMSDDKVAACRDQACRQGDFLYAWAARRADARAVLRFAVDTIRPDLYKAAIRSLDDLDDADFYMHADSVSA